MRTLAFILTVAAVTLETSAAAPQPPPERWDLARLEKEAVARQPALAAARADVALGQARRMEAAWARFPRFEWTSVIAPVPTLKGNVLETSTPTNPFVGF